MSKCAVCMEMILAAYLCVGHSWGLLFLVKSNCDLNSDCDSEIEERRLSVKRRKKGFSSPKQSDVVTKKSVQTSFSGSRDTVAYASDSNGVNVCVKRR